MRLWLARKLKAHLDEEIKLYNQKSPGLLKIIRHAERKGLAAARNTGREAATADVVAILDAHVEVNVGWWVSRGLLLGKGGRGEARVATGEE